MTDAFPYAFDDVAIVEKKPRHSAIAVTAVFFAPFE